MAEAQTAIIEVNPNSSSRPIETTSSWIVTLELDQKKKGRTVKLVKSNQVIGITTGNNKLSQSKNNQLEIVN